MSKPKNGFFEWLESDEGKTSMAPADFTTSKSLKYLENRLWYAYTTGVANTIQANISTPAQPSIGYSREQVEAAHTEGVLLAQQVEVFKKTDGRRQVTRLEADAFINSLPAPGQLPGVGECLDKANAVDTFKRGKDDSYILTKDEMRAVIQFAQTPKK